MNSMSAMTTVPATWAMIFGSRGAMRHDHEEGDARAGAEENGRADDMDEAKQVFHRSSLVQYGEGRERQHDRRQNLHQRPKRIGPEDRVQGSRLAR